MLGYHIRNKALPSILASMAMIVLALVASTVALAQRVSLDRVIAIVDEDVILQSELENRMMLTVDQFRATNQPLPGEEELREQLLEALILENLQLQLANRMSIRFDDDTLNRVLANIAEQNNMNFDEYVASLETQGRYRATRDQVRRELSLRELQRAVVNQRISITDQEIENFLNSEMGRSAMAADYLVDHMLVPVAANDRSGVQEAKLAYASELVASVEQGAEFASTRLQAQQEGRFQVTGTNFGWRRLEQIPSLFGEIVPTMQVGDVAGPIRAGNGFHIITLSDMRGGTNRIVNQTHLRHIMVTPNEIRDEEQSVVLLENLRDQILQGEDFATLARQNSEDASSVVAGGDLDWVNEGGMPQEMEAVANALEVGELSHPFQTNTGWHIMEVLGRREQDLSQEYSRMQAENALRGRKYELELQNWLIEIREGAFVELID